MEENIPDPKVLQSQAVKRAIFIKKAFFGLIIVLVVITILAIGYYLFVPKPNLPDGKSPTSTLKPENKSPDEIVAKVGLEKLYKADLDYYLSTYFAGQGYTPKDQALEKMIDDSIILQEGQKSGFISFSNNTFNNPNKDILKRNNLVTTAKGQLIEKNVSEISGEVIAIWFNNSSYPPPEIGVDEAKKIAKAKIDNIYRLLKNGEISMLQAGNMIKRDTSLAKIDPSYKNNAYSKITNVKRSDKLFLDPKIDKQVWRMAKGELSDVLLAYDTVGAKRTEVEALYMVIKLDSQKIGAADSFESWLQGIKNNYEISKY